jgi:hypothetical protein
MDSKSPRKDKKSKPKEKTPAPEEINVENVEEEEKKPVKKANEIRDFSNYHATPEQIEEE